MDAEGAPTKQRKQGDTISPFLIKNVANKILEWKKKLPDHILDYMRMANISSQCVALIVSGKVCKRYHTIPGETQTKKKGEEMNRGRSSIISIVLKEHRRPKVPLILVAEKMHKKKKPNSVLPCWTIVGSTLEKSKDCGFWYLRDTMIPEKKADDGIHFRLNVSKGKKGNCSVAFFVYDLEDLAADPSVSGIFTIPSVSGIFTISSRLRGTGNVEAGRMLIEASRKNMLKEAHYKSESFLLNLLAFHQAATKKNSKIASKKEIDDLEKMMGQIYKSPKCAMAIMKGLHKGMFGSNGEEEDKITEDDKGKEPMMESSGSEEGEVLDQGRANTPPPPPNEDDPTPAGGVRGENHSREALHLACPQQDEGIATVEGRDATEFQGSVGHEDRSHSVRTVASAVVGGRVDLLEWQAHHPPIRDLPDRNQRQQLGLAGLLEAQRTLPTHQYQGASSLGTPYQSSSYYSVESVPPCAVGFQSSGHNPSLGQLDIRYEQSDENSLPPLFDLPASPALPL